MWGGEEEIHLKKERISNRDSGFDWNKIEEEIR